MKKISRRKAIGAVTASIAGATVLPTQANIELKKWKVIGYAYGWQGETGRIKLRLETRPEKTEILDYKSPEVFANILNILKNSEKNLDVYYDSDGFLFSGPDLSNW